MRQFRKVAAEDFEILKSETREKYLELFPEEYDNHLDYPEKGYGAHLHLQMFLTESSPDDFINIDMDFNKLKNAKGKNDGIACINKNIVNLFNYTKVTWSRHADGSCDYD